MDFSKYKPYLLDYLNKCGCNVQLGVNRCFNPKHDDHNPSCEIFTDHFVCYSGSCGIHGDIYDAVQIVEGIEGQQEQYKHLESIYGGNDYTLTPLKKIEKTKERELFVPDEKSIEKLDEYFKSHNARESQIKAFLKMRAIISSHKEITSYPEEILEKLVTHFFYWPGLATAKADGLTLDTLRTAGIPQEKKETGISSWGHSGIVLKLGTGYKLYFYNEGVSEKRGSKGCITFPMPGTINDETESIILVEGEIDAVVCNAAGIQNVYSTGGTNGLTKPKIQKHLLKENLKEIIILYDNDIPGRKAAGIVPFEANDKNKSSLPKRLREAGYKGSIKIALLSDYKDPDEAILHGRLDLVQKAITEAKEWTAKDIESAPIEHQGKMTLKDMGALLGKLPISELEESERQRFISAAMNATSHSEQVKNMLLGWGANKDQVNKKHTEDPYYLYEMAKAHELSYYFQNKIKEATISKKVVEEYFSGSKRKPLFPIKYKVLDDLTELKSFIFKRSDDAAAVLLEAVLSGRFIYLQTEKEFYFFNGLTWEFTSAVADVAHNILEDVIKHYLKSTDKEDTTKIKALNTALTKIGEYKYCISVMNALKEKDSIFKKQVTFDGPQIQETLTLQDGVMDFSGKTIRYRNAKPEEYRMAKLPYTVDQVRANKEPVNFLKFMASNFENKDTLETLMYFLSLIPSRRALFKVGGIFTGITNTGKTTTMKVIQECYTNMSRPLPRSVIMQKRYEDNGAPNPYLARLEGSGVAISDETKRNDMLDGAMWKQLTGGGMLTARGMYAQPRDFMPTAQIVILTNFSPKFDGKDQATIERMVIVPFRIQHKKGDKNTVSEDDLFAGIRPEYPSVVRLFAEYYIRLRQEYKDKIPLSKECQAYKDDYVQDQETDLDKFVTDNIDFVKDVNCYVPLKDLYLRYCQYNEIDVDEFGKPTDREAWTQSKFTRYLKNDYQEFHVKMVKINGQAVRVAINTKLKELQITPKTPVKTTEKPAQKQLFKPQKNINDTFDPDEENPFD